jgi:hypothetical protein
MTDDETVLLIIQTTRGIRIQDQGLSVATAEAEGREDLPACLLACLPAWLGVSCRAPNRGEP